MLKQILTVMSSVAITAAFAVDYTWTGGGDGINLGSAANWGGTAPGGANPDTGIFNGVTTSNLFLKHNTQLPGGFGTIGIRFAFGSNQTNSVNWASSVALSPYIGLGWITISNGAGAFSMGDNTANVLDVIWRAPDPVPYPPHLLENNSANPVTIYPNVRWRAGGGNAHTLDFAGSGDWIINNYLKGANNTPTLIVKDGTGTFTWTGANVPGSVGTDPIGSPFVINGGTVVLKTAGLLDTQRITNNGAMLRYDAAGAQTLSGPMHGSGLLMVSAGTLTLSSGASDFDGNIILTNGAKLVVAGGENPGVTGPLGTNGLISFSGGTLGFSVNNTYDYSPRFDTSANQAYSFDTAGQNVTLAANLASTGASLTKSGAGTLTLAGTSSYSGPTVINGGRVVFMGPKTGTGSITVPDGGALDVTANGTQVTPSTLTLGTSSGAALGFDNVSSTTTAPLAANTLVSAGVIVINVNSGTFAPGQSYPLLSWTSGAAPAVTLGTLTGAEGNLSTNGNTIQLNVTAIAYTWTGNANGNWDITTANNWSTNGVSAIFVNGNPALFDDSATGETNVVLNSAVSPSSVTVSSDDKTYSITSSGANVIGGSGALTKGGGSTLMLAGGVNSYSGPTIISGGTLGVDVLANGGVASDIGTSGNGAANLVLNGGTLSYAGGAASIDRLFTVGTGGGAIVASGSDALNLNNSGSVGLSGAGARVLTLRGANTNDNTLAASLSDSGGATSLGKSGAGKWVLTGDNAHSGGTTIAGGTLQVGAGGASGSLGSGSVTANGALIFNRTGTLTNPGAISGNGSLTKSGSSTLILAGNNTYTGGTTVEAGALQIGNGGATGSLYPQGAIVNNSTVIFNSTSDQAYFAGGVISGTGNVIVRGTGIVKAIGANSYTGWTSIEPGATFWPAEGNTGGLVSSVVTNNGTLKLVRQDNLVFVYSNNIVGSGRVVRDVNNDNVGDVTFLGNNTYTGGTWISGGILILGDGFSPNAGSIVGDVLFTNSPIADVAKILAFNRAEDVTFPGLITYAATLPFGNRGVVRQDGFYMLTLTGNNDYPGGTVINAGTVQVGNGGATGAIGTGPVTDNGALIWNRSTDATFGGAISGSGTFTKTGAGALTLTGNNSYTGDTTVSNGVLVVNGTNSSFNVWVHGGTLAGKGDFMGIVQIYPGAALAPGDGVGTMTCDSLYLFGGNVNVEINKLIAQTNDFVYVTNTAGYYGGGTTLTVSNLGPALKVGDTFKLFSQPLASGDLITVTGAGSTWTNKLAVDGTITALTVPAVTTPTPTNITYSLVGDQLTVSWPGGQGWILQTQTNALTTGLSNNWYDLVDSFSTSQKVFTVSPANPTVFFRLRY